MRASARGWTIRRRGAAAVASLPEEAIEGSLDFAVSALRGRTASDVARTTLAHVRGTFGLPAAAWAAEDSGSDLSLVGTVGTDGVPGGGPLATDLPLAHRWRLLSRAEQRAFLSRFARSAGRLSAEAVDAEDILVVVAGVSPEGSRRFREVRRFLLELMPSLGGVDDGLPDPLLDALSFAAHELRGPLLGARAAVEMALRDPDSPDARRLLARSVADLDWLAREVGEILDWAARVEAVVPRPTPVEELLREACATAIATTGADGSRIAVEGDTGISVAVEPRSIVSAVSNLIRNALAYSPSDTRIEVRAEAQGDMVSITVSDSGPGIPRTERERLFAPFTRGRAAARAGHDGAGLGLFIAGKVVTAHGGRIYLRPSEHGSTFTIELPRAEDGT